MLKKKRLTTFIIIHHLHSCLLILVSFFHIFIITVFVTHRAKKRITDDSATIAKNSLHTIVHITISFDSSAVVELKRVQRCSRLCFISACELEIHPVSLSLSFFLSLDSTFGEMNTGGCTTVTESSCH